MKTRHPRFGDPPGGRGRHLMNGRHDAPQAGRDTGIAQASSRQGTTPKERDPLQARRLNGPGSTEREIEMNRNGGVGIIGVIVIVVVILFLVGVIRL
jgi:hypothetical protein